MQYSCNCVLGIIWVFCPKISPKIIALCFLYNSLAVLVRHSQTYKCLGINPKPFQQVFMSYLCLPVLFVDNARRQFVIAQYGFFTLFPSIFQSKGKQESFLHCYSLVMQCNKRNIATNEAHRSHHFSEPNWILGARYGFPLAFCLHFP